MAITRTPIIDDDGTGTTGTVIDHAWKEEFYNQIDAAVGVVSVLGSGSGVASNVAADNFAFFPVPQLTLKDTVIVSGVAVNTGTAAIGLNLGWYDPGSSGIITAIALTGPTGAGTFAGSNVLTWRVLFRPTPPGPANMQGLGSAVLTIGTTQAMGTTFGLLSTANFTSAGAGYLYYSHTGIANGTMPWSWSAQLVKG